MNYNINLKKLCEDFDIDSFLEQYKVVNKKKNPFVYNDRETVILFGKTVPLYTFLKRKDTYLFITDCTTGYKGDSIVDGFVVTQEQYRHYILTELLSDCEGETDNV